MIERFARHPVAANLTMLAMIMAGIWAIRVMPTQLDPPAHLPWIIIEVTWKGAGAEDVEALVTRPIEAQLRTLKDLRSHNSRSVDGYMRLVLQLDFDADVTESLDTVKQRVASLRNLPTGIETPIIRRALDYEPIARLIVTGPGTLAELVPEVRAMEQSLLDAGIEAIYLSGLPAEEIALQVRSEQLAALELTLSDLATKVAAESRNAPGGALGNGSGATQLRSLADRRDPLDYDTLLISHGGQLLRLGDIAEVVRRSRPGEPQITSDGRAAIELRLLRNTATDAYRSELALREWLEETRPQLPAGIQIVESQNVWQLLGAQLDMIILNGLSGLLLVIGVLYLFLNVRAAWWVMLGIPVSFMLALALFHLGFGYGISIIALIGLIMALGIVVDDAIVVGEDIVALTEQGMAPQEAAVLGAQRMFAPVVTSSLTTLAAFLPLLIIGGVMGDVILALPTLLLCVILASLFECFLVLPGHLGHRLSPLGHPDEGFGEGPGEHRSSWRRRFNDAFAEFRDGRFLSWVDWALAHPGVTLTAAGSSLLVAIMLLVSQHVGFNLVTSMDIDSLQADVAFSASATSEERQQFLQELEATLNDTDAAYDNRNLQGYSTRVALARFEDDDETGEQFASVRADYAYAETRTLSPDEFAAAWRDRVIVPPYVERLRIRAGGGAGGDQPDLSLILRGQEFEALRSAARELTAQLRRYPGVSNVLDNLPPAREQIVFTLLPSGEQLGLSTQAVAAQLRDAYSGTLIQIFNEHNAELEVRMLLPERERRDLSLLGQFPIRVGDGGVVPLASIATLTRRTGTDLIRHSDGELAVTVSADVDPEISNAIQVLNEVTDTVLPPLLQRYELDYGLGGKSRDDAVLLETMQLGGLLTLLLIYLILAWAFASYLWPLAIMLAIPFGFTGAVFGHWVMDWDIGAMSLLAFFSLTGIVVNDSIVLISFLRRELAAGVGLESALRDAVRARFRAVLLTSLTTIAGLLPLLFTNSSLSLYVTPIAITLCFGLAFATLLVLIVIPALLLLLERGKAQAGRQLARLLAVARTTLPIRNPTPSTKPDPFHQAGK